MSWSPYIRCSTRKCVDGSPGKRSRRSTKFMRDMIVRFQHMYDKLNENEKNMADELKTLKDDVITFLDH
eukprot:1019606-Amphidinium_carterae.2